MDNNLQQRNLSPAQILYGGIRLDNNNNQNQSTLEKIENNVKQSKFQIDLHDLNESIFNQNSGKDLKIRLSQDNVAEAKKCKFSNGESNIMEKFLELKKEERALRQLSKEIEIVIEKLDEHAKVLTEGLSKTTKEGRHCRSKSLAKFSGPNGFPLVSRNTLQTPHLCHISSIQFQEAKVYKRFKHVPHFPQHVQSYPCGLRMFALANSTVKRINSNIEERKNLTMSISSLRLLQDKIIYELKHNASKLEQCKKVIDKNRTGRERYVCIKNRYFNSLRLMNPSLKIFSLGDQKEPQSPKENAPFDEEILQNDLDDICSHYEEKFQSILSSRQ
jgi:hypothetical protein